MEKEPNLEDWLKTFNASENKATESLPEEFNFKLHTKEIAYHEAGHFLIDCLVMKENLGFTKIIEVQIFIGENQVRGDVKREANPTFYNDSQLKKFYLDDINRSAYKLLSLCAGYATYLKYLRKSEKEKEYYIGIYEGNKIFGRYSLKNFPRDDRDFDYMKIKTHIEYYGIRENEKLIEIIDFVNKEFIKLMSKSGNICALGFVKNRLMKNNKARIFGNQLEHMINRVNKHTKQITLSSVLTRIGKKIMSMKN